MAIIIRRLLLNLCLCVVIAETVANNESLAIRKDLYIMGLYPMSGSWAGGPALLAATEMGLKHVNARPDILPGYKLNLIWSDTKCDPGYGVHVMYKRFNESPIKLMIFGAACSKVSQPTAESSHHWNVLQLSYASVSPALSDKKRYPRFFRVASSDIMMNPARLEMMENFSWQRAATIHESHEIFSKVTDDIVARFRERNVTLVTAEIFTDDPTNQIQNLKKHDARIIFAGFYEDKALKVFCEAYRQGVYGPHIVWILVGWYNDKWWQRRDVTQQETGCTSEEIARAAEGHFATGIVYVNPNDDVTDYGFTPQEFLKMYANYTDHQTLFGDNMASQGFDGVYAISLALNATVDDLKRSGSGKRLEDFTYDDSEMANMIMANMWRVRFQGIKSFIFFNQFGEHPGMVKIDRLQDGRRQTTGIFDPVSDSINWVDTNPITWKGGAPPADATTTIIVPENVSPLIYSVMSSLAALGILQSLLFLGINWKFRKARLIKMSSPFMNNIIVLGCIVVYCTVFFKELERAATSVMCQIRTFTLMVGFSMAFGALFAKTWRVHLIFTNKLKRVIMRDRKLVLIVCGIVLCDVIIFTVFATVDAVVVQTVNTTTEINDNGNVVHQSQVYLCTSAHQLHFQATVFVSKGLLLLFGAFLAWETKKVTIPALNDSQYIGVCIYNVVVLSIMGVVLAVLLLHQVALHYVLTSALLILTTTMTQSIIFVPKIIKLHEARSKVSDDGTDPTVDEGRTEFATHGDRPGTESVSGVAARRGEGGTAGERCAVCGATRGVREQTHAE